MAEKKPRSLETWKHANPTIQKPWETLEGCLKGGPNSGICLLTHSFRVSRCQSIKGATPANHSTQSEEVSFIVVGTCSFVCGVFWVSVHFQWGLPKKKAFAHQGLES